ncbi:MAG: type II toxin-antitoxin system Phd/YefM family antitoxin [Bacteroidetes bacterium]|nr:type II toxin-antitoxin system Phd/YefM family antitoxin [Bacteroidota bacterium]
MAIIKSISDLKNKSNEISSLANSNHEPIFITKNGEGDLVVLSIQEYRKMKLQLDLFAKLSVAEQEWNEGKRGRSSKDVIKSLKSRLAEREN